MYLHAYQVVILCVLLFVLISVLVRATRERAMLVKAEATLAQYRVNMQQLERWLAQYDDIDAVLSWLHERSEALPGAPSVTRGMSVGDLRAHVMKLRNRA